MTGVFEVTVRSITAAREQTLYLDGRRERCRAILLVDDGLDRRVGAGTRVLVTKAGGIVCGRMAILAEGGTQARENLIYLEKLPLFTGGEPIQ